MGQKSKKGKSRKDKYYNLAKEQGYRARSAFKLIQLNKRYDFLGSSKVVIDLCAAPGGWLQVASKNMPINSLIIGVDLVPIKPIQNCITLTADITTERCRTLLNSHLKTWKADVILHDGAPNVGTSWIQDAYSQTELVLKAFKLCTEFLKQGGIFLTKIFRSRDYNNMMWVFNQLFESVESTKPSSSRNESAEIFVFCKGYLAPKKVDPKFTDPVYVFKELGSENDKNATKSIFAVLKKPKKSALGYEEENYKMTKKLELEEFIKSETPTVKIVGYTEIVADSELSQKIFNHKATTDDIRDLFKDLNLLSKVDFKKLFKWRELILKLDVMPKKESEDVKEDDHNASDSDNIEEQLEKCISSNSKKQIQNKKKLLKKKQKELIKLQLKKQFPQSLEGTGLFASGKKIQEHEFGSDNDSDVDQVETAAQDYDSYEYIQISKEEADLKLEAMLDEQYELYKEKNCDLKEKLSLNDKEDYYYSDKDDISSIISLSDEDDSDKNEEKIEKVNPKASIWFDRPEFKNIAPLKRPESSKKEQSSEEAPKKKAKTEEPSETKKEKKLTIDTEEEFALAYQIVNKEKTIHTLVDEGHHKEIFNDTSSLPKWFAEEEKMYRFKQIPITKEVAMQYRKEKEAIDSRPIKKVLEAKARRRNRHLKKMKKLTETANAIVENSEISEKEKATTIQKILAKKSLKTPGRKTTYVVTKNRSSVPPGRPKGVKGRYKRVDSTMKKELRAQQIRKNKQKKK